MDLASLITNHRPNPVKPRHLDLQTPPLPTTTSSSYFTTAAAATTSYVRSPQPPLSPPVDDQPKCSLPSISTLLEGADSAFHSAKRPRYSPDSESRRSYQSYDPVTAHLPPTPPLRPGSGFSSSNHPSPSTTVKTTEQQQQQQPPPPYSLLPNPTMDRPSISSQGSSARHSLSAMPQYPSPASSVASYSSPVEPSPSSSTYFQRPHASSVSSIATTIATTATASTPTPSVAVAVSTTAAATAITTPTTQSTLPSPSSPTGQHHHHHQQQIISPVTPAWQHHHYFPPSNTAPYQQNHDRYICRTCHKAFSRPSSLRIHSHSHTGEKPFRCTHAGCGKAFSVRSNMKRHERGCHTGRPVQAIV
ncbi:hypothetical protein ASPZODRAFT_136621 [Penicilliopsis zonata CBS 506.65]|uniref:C2H2-type domain-containing protein n=1 Tax=Penicilliopsis zonata CBS 506.65 TaxID=1073090 RepID=A0A1L9S7F4_9EURO|nr:hypothetical protein ASPZODRAFT_136621 [Penicilliopsis zonata CBS 506.65]OJJ43073.1 hypothetical protein ASPZODRAFT_136621 [Penicilliopsis zonata CBS 506.65]